MQPKRGKPRAAKRSNGGLQGIFGALFSFEALFLLFFWAGRYKAIPQLTGFPVDLTLLFLVASLGLAVVVVFREVDATRAIQDKATVLYILFLLWIVATYFWSSQLNENKEKLTYTLTLLTWSFLGTYIIISTSEERVRRFVGLIMAFSVAMILYWFYIKFALGIDINNSASPVVGPNYLGYGENALCLYLGFFALALKVRRVSVVFLSVIGMAVMLLIMMSLGGKGPLLLALLAPALMALWILMKNGMNVTFPKIIQMTLIAAALLGVALFAISLLSQDFLEVARGHMRTLDRLTGSLGQSDFGDSASSRLDGQRLALNHWFQQPLFGWGIGEYSVIDGFLRYPHNLALEILMELGLIGFLLFMGLILLTISRIWSVWPRDLSDWTTMVMGMLFITLILSRMTFQGYLPDERFLFTLAGFLLGLGREHKRAHRVRRPAHRGRSAHGKRWTHIDRGRPVQGSPSPG